MLETSEPAYPTSPSQPVDEIEVSNSEGLSSTEDFQASTPTPKEPLVRRL